MKAMLAAIIAKLLMSISDTFNNIYSRNNIIHRFNTIYI